MTNRRERNGRRKSDPGTLSYRTIQEKGVVAAELPWGVAKMVPLAALDFQLPSGVFTAQSVLLELFSLFERKLNTVVEEEPLEKLVNKSLQRGEDPYLDNLCRTLNGICELSLPSVLNALIAWYERQEKQITDKINPANDSRFRLGKRLLAVNYLFCLVLIEILPQVEFHLSNCESLVSYIMKLAFKQVSYRDPSTLGVNHTNSLIVAETYAEVIGVLSNTHFQAIHKTFFGILNEYKKETTPASTLNIIALLMAMKFVKIKTNQVLEFEMGIGFLDELGTYFLEVKDKDVKHAAAGLLVEILLPVAAQIKREANIPALIAFVQKLYGPTNDLANKKQHKLAAYPLLTCLLCVAQRQFFLSNWVPFLNSTLASLRNKDSKISRVALESLYRLLWVYIIRNNCDGNQATRTRLDSICGSLFPKGNRSIVPRDAPLNIFVKIIHFIAQQKLDFAFKEIIFDLLGCQRTNRSLYPERMNIGIRALMVIADGLQQKDEPPAMPKSMGPLASGTMLRLKKKTYITRPLTVDIARSIGLDQYYIPCRKAFDTILRVLDAQVGKPLMLTAIQGRGKEPEELMAGDVKPKLDLFRTCVAAIPRLLPEPMTHIELIDILTRISIHVDEELRSMAGQTLQNLVGEFPEWREHVINATLNLLTNQLTDTYPTILDHSLRLLCQLVTAWRIAAVAEKRKNEEKDEQKDSFSAAPTASAASSSVAPSSPSTAGHSINASTASGASTVSPGLNMPLYMINYASVLHSIEGFALVMLCQIRVQPRKMAISLLKEVKHIFSLLPVENHDSPVITVLDEATPYVIRKYIEHVPLYERQSWNVDFAGAYDKITSIEPDNCLVNSDRGNEYMQWDAWACALSGYSESRFLLTRCPSAVAAAWPALFIRLNAVNAYVDPSNPQNESRASLLRSSKSKASSVCGEQISQDGCLSLWQKYLLLCCAFCPAPTNHNSLISRSFSPTSSVDTDVLRSVSSSLRTRTAPASLTAQQLFQKAIGMLRWENTDIRDSVVLGVGSMNPAAFDAFLDELNARGVLREAQEKKLESNVRRRKRKDLLRLQLLRLIEVAIFRGLLDVNLGESGQLNQLALDYIESMRINLESDQDRDITIITSMRLHFAKLIALIVDSVPHEQRINLIPDERKQSLFYLFTGWCSRSIASHDKKIKENEVGSYVEQKAVLAMCRLLCCGPIFEASKSIGHDGYLYGWLEKLVASTNHTMQCEVEEMLAWMVQLNESAEMLDWIVAQCYVQSSEVSSRCFSGLVRAFSRRELPCEFVSLFVLCQKAAADRSVADAAVEMLEMLRKQFLDSSSAMASPLLFASSPSSSSIPLRQHRSAGLLVPNDGHCLPVEQLSICRQLAKAYPQWTITVFSEVCARMESSRSHNQTALVSLLLPWIDNLELVDSAAGEDACEGPRGWGSEEATQLLLNNLMYLTVTYTDHEKELSELWKGLAQAFPANLPIIVNYLYVITNLCADRLLHHTKRVAVMLASVSGNRLAAILLEQLVSNETSRTTLERCEMPPYYRWRDDGDGTGGRNKESGEASANSADNSPRDSEPPTARNHVSEETATEGVRQLPMPAYGGHYSTLSAYLPPVTQPIQFFSRSQVALLLLCDVIRSSCDVDWTEATPRLLHAAVLHLDSLRPALCSHGRQTIINVCLLHADRSILHQVSSILLENQMSCCNPSHRIPPPPSPQQADRSSELHHQSRTRKDTWRQRGESPTFTKLAHDEYRQMLLQSNAMFTSHNELVLAIVFCLSENMESPLWANEDASARCWRVASAQQLSCLVRHLAELLLPSMPLLPVVWTQISMKMALSVPSRHSAGRCFQIVSALCQPAGAWIPSLLSRLVETAGEQHEDTQAYVTDLLLCLHSAVQHLSPITELSTSMTTAVSPTHARSTSYTPALLRQSVISQRLHERKDARFSLLVAEDEPWVGQALMRSKSAEQLKSDGEEEEAAARVQMLAISVALLESAIENEFLLALHLLDKIISAGETHKQQCLEKLEKTLKQLDWKAFTGIVGLVTRGTVIPGAYEATIEALLNLVELVEHPVVGGRESLGLIITAILPYLLVNFEQPNPLCLKAAGTLKEFCTSLTTTLDEQQTTNDHPLTHLATMLHQYSCRTFSKDRFQWAKCVVQYMCEGLKPNETHLVVLLAEMLERGPATVHVYALHMIYLLIIHRDSSPSNMCLNAQVVRAVARHVQGANWREASRVFKAIVEQWQHQVRDEKDSASACDIPFDISLLNGESPSSPRKNTTDNSLPKRQPLPHVRVRERLVALLSASGLRVGVPHAPSVVFSHSSELGSAASSTERICSSRDVDSTTSLPADPSVTDSFPRVFKEFDFLEAEHDSVSETADSCFGWLSTMRPTSIADRDRSASSAAEEDLEDEADDESSEDTKRSGSGQRTHSPHSRTSTSDERTPCPSDVDEDDLDHIKEDECVSDDEEEMEVLSQRVELRSEPRSEYGRSDFGREDVRSMVVPENASIAGSSFYCRSEGSVDYPRLPPILVQCSHHIGGSHMESSWIRAVSELNDDHDGEMTAHSTLMLTQLFRSCCAKVCSLLRDASLVFVSSPLGNAFNSAQAVLTRVADCPFLFVTAQYLVRSGTLQRLKLSLCELREHFETFSERREQSMRALTAVKSAQKLSVLGGSTSSLNSINPRQTEHDLAKSLHKLFFQLMLMNDSLCDMVRTVRDSHNAQDFSLSPAVLCLQRELLQCAADLPGEALLPRDSYADSLLLLIANKQHAQAIAAVRQLRANGGAEWGCCEVVDVDVLLLLFCRSHTMRAWAVVGAEESALGTQSQLLREANADLASAVRRAGTIEAGGSLGIASGAGTVVSTGRAPTVSSVTDSFSKITGLAGSDSPSFSQRSDFYGM